MNRLHPQDLRAIVAAIYDASPNAIYHTRLAVTQAERLMAELERTSKPEAPAPIRTRSVGCTHEPNVAGRCIMCGEDLSGRPARTCSEVDETAPEPGAEIPPMPEMPGPFARDGYGWVDKVEAWGRDLAHRLTEARAEVDRLKVERDGWEEVAKIAREGGAREERERIIALLVDPGGSLGLTARDYPSPEEWGVLSHAADIRAALEAKP